jgi:nitronate monooxygenase
MLAGVDYVLMGAGIPWQIPGILDNLAHHRPVTLRIGVEGDASGEDAVLAFDPARHVEQPHPPLKRPNFLAIVSSSTLAQALLKRATGRIDGFVVECKTAGGHNAPPRGATKLNERGEPVYGARDEVDPAKMRELGLPFWLAGSQGRPGRVAAAKAAGAVGIQVGTLFAFCRESGLAPELRRQALASVRDHGMDVFTDPLASPTGFPFKVVRLEGSLSDPEVLAARPRVCDAGYLRRLCRMPDGSIAYRCPSEPVDAYVAKGGDAADAAGRCCLCNALISNIGLPQVRPNGEVEGPLLTAGDDLCLLAEVMGEKLMDYSAAEAIGVLLATAPEPAGV